MSNGNVRGVLLTRATHSLVVLGVRGVLLTPSGALLLGGRNGGDFGRSEDLEIALGVYSGLAVFQVAAASCRSYGSALLRGEHQRIAGGRTVQTTVQIALMRSFANANDIGRLECRGIAVRRGIETRFHVAAR